MENVKAIGFSEMSTADLQNTDGGLIFTATVLVVAKVAKVTIATSKTATTVAKVATVADLAVAGAGLGYLNNRKN